MIILKENLMLNLNSKTMKRKNLIRPIIVLAVTTLIVVACEKSDAPAVTLTSEDIILAKDDVAADDIYTEIDASVLEKISDLENSDYQVVTEKSALGDFPCLVVTVDYPDTTRFPKVITLDYGEGCTVILHNDTITKKGEIIITVTDRRFVVGSKHIITFDNFYVNDIKVEGTLTTTYLGISNEGLLQFDFQLEDGKLIFYDEASGQSLEYTRDADMLKEWYRAPIPVEDSIYLSGSMWGVNVIGENYGCVITGKLTLAHCLDYGRRWVIVDGQIVYTVGDTERIIDYSDGACDGTAAIRGNGVGHRIRVRELHRHHELPNDGN